MPKQFWEKFHIWSVLLGIFLLSWSLAYTLGPIKKDFDPREYLGSKSPYRNQSPAIPIASLRDCQPIFINHIGRHGSRHMSNGISNWLINIIAKAQKEGGLTELGLVLPDLIAKAQASENSTNRGQLSKLGQEEQQKIAKRLYQSFPEIFISNKHLFLKSTHVQRTKDSMKAFFEALLEENPSLATKAELFSKNPQECDPTLRFFDGCKAYKDYKANKPFKAQIEEAVFSKEVIGHIGGMLGRIFTKEFIAILDQASTIDLARKLYRMCQLDADLGYDISSSGFCSLFTSPSEMEPFNLEDDAHDYVIKGPINNSGGISHKIACPLVKDFIDSTENAINDQQNSPKAIFRFAHAETILPFLTELGLFQKDSLNDILYRPKKRQWRSAYISPMAANLQWIVYRCPNNDYRVRMRHNEKDIPFPIPGCEKSSCQFETIKKFYEDRKSTCDEQTWATNICQELSCKF